jgi:hypothetical protein
MRIPQVLVILVEFPVCVYGVSSQVVCMEEHHTSGFAFVLAPTAVLLLGVACPPLSPLRCNLTLTLTLTLFVGLCPTRNHHTRIIDIIVRRLQWIFAGLPPYPAGRQVRLTRHLLAGLPAGLPAGPRHNFAPKY